MIRPGMTEGARLASSAGWPYQLPRWFVGLVLVATGTGKALGFCRKFSADALSGMLLCRNDRGEAL